MFLDILNLWYLRRQSPFLILFNLDTQVDNHVELQQAL